MKPFILVGAITIPSDETLSRSHVYDMDLQLWIDKETMAPVIDSYTNNQATKYGETIMTATIEGADQPEVASTSPSSKHSIVSTLPNNHAVPEKILINGPSQFGETLITKTAEGVDTSEISLDPCMDVDAPHSHF